MANINLHNISREEKALYATYKNLISFGKLFLPGDFLKTQPTPFHHYEMAKELLSPSNKPCAFIVARGHGKTTLTKAKIIHDLVFAKKAYEWGFVDREENYFFAWSADTQRKSIANVEYVQYFLSDDPKIRYYFGNLKGRIWNQEDIVTKNGDKLMSTSNLTSIRGFTKVTRTEGAIRYSNVFIDDPEGEKNTITENSRDRIKDTILNAIKSAIEVDKPGARLFYSGTPIHQDSFCQMILDEWAEFVKSYGGVEPYYWTDDEEQLEIRKQAEKDFLWRVITYKATQPNRPEGVLWFPVYSREKLEQKKSEWRINPKRGESGYYQEFELEVVREEDAMIGRKSIKYWDGYYTRENDINFLVIDGEKIPVNTFNGCDPATDINTKMSDFSAIVDIAVDKNNNVYVLEYEYHRNIPTLGLKDKDWNLIDKEGVVDYLIKHHLKYNMKHSCVEDVAMNRSIFQALIAEKKRLNLLHLVTIPENPTGKGDKLNRIYSTLNHRFASGSVYLRENHYQLINQIAKFGPKMGHDDLIDALHLACLRAYPPNFEFNTEKKEYYIPKRKPRDWRGFKQEHAQYN